MRRTIVALALLGLLASCTSADDATPAPEGPDRLVVGTTDALRGLDPAACYEVFCAYVLLPNIHEGLVRLEAGSAEPVPALARDWEVSEDATVYTFRLREDVLLHDGTEVTAEVVRASLERVRRLGGDPAFLLYDPDADPPRHGITQIETPDPATVSITLAAPDAAFPSKLAFPVASVVGEPGDEGLPPGAGPFHVARADEDVIELERVGEHHGAAAREERVLIRRYPSGVDLRSALTRGEVHVAVRNWTLEDVAALRRLGGVQLVEGPSASVRFAAFNVERPPFDRLAVRRAIAAALDRQALVGGPLSDAARPLYSLVPEGMGASEQVFFNTEDPEQAGRLLDEAEIAGPVEVALWYTPSHYGEAEEQVATAIAGMLRATGRFEVSLHAADWGDYRSSFSRGRFGMYLLGWFPDHLDPQDYLRPFMGSGGARAVGSNYAEPEVDELLGAEARTVGADERREILAKLQERLAADVPYIPLWQPSRYVAVRGATGVGLDLSQVLRLAPVRRGS